MGHADIQTTLNIYAKAVPGWEEQAPAKLDAYAYLDARATVARQSDSDPGRSSAVPQRLNVAQ
jgi:hypothetical protein